MRNRHVRLAVLAALSSASALGAFSAVADGTVIFDGSTGGPGLLDSVNGVYNITQADGLLKGTNLFHSFEIFNIDQGETAVFSGNAAITNIISRVTGGLPTTIDGTIRSTINGANFWFVNPAGLTVGPSGAIDVSGAVALGTADYVDFANGERFMALPDEDGNLSVAFSMSAPVDFGFLQDSFGGGQLVIQSSDLLSRTASASNNQIQPLAGGGSYSMLLSGAGGVFLENQTGNIEMHDVRIRTGIDAETGMNGNISLQASGSINMSNSDLLTSANPLAFGGGDIFIQGGELVTISGSSVVAESIDAFDNTGSINISGSGVLINDYSQIALNFRDSFGGIDGVGVGRISIGSTGVSDEVAPQTNLSTATAGVVRIVDSQITANNTGSLLSQSIFFPEESSIQIGSTPVPGGFPDGDFDPGFDPDDPTFDPSDPGGGMAASTTTHVVIAGSTISTDATDGGFATNSTISAQGGVWIVDSTNGHSSVTARASDTALNAGAINVIAGSAGITVENATLDTLNSAPGLEDNNLNLSGVSFSAGGDVRINNSMLRVDADNGFLAGTVLIQSNSLYIKDSTFTSSTTVRDPTRTPVNSTFTAAGILLMAGSPSDIFPDEDFPDEDFPDEGTPTPSPSVALIENSTLRANSRNDGSPTSDPIGANAGQIQIFGGTVTVHDSTLESAATGANAGASGVIGFAANDIEVANSTLNVTNESLNPDVIDAAFFADQANAIGFDAINSVKITNSTLTANTSGVATGGDVGVFGSTIDILGSSIQATTTSTGSAGTVFMVAFPIDFLFGDPDDPSAPPDPTTLAGIRITDSTIATSTGATPSNAGSIDILSFGGLEVTRSSLNVSATANSATTGNDASDPSVPVPVPGNVDLFGTGNISLFSFTQTSITDSNLQANTSGVVNGGNIDVEGAGVVVRNSSITASSSATNTNDSADDPIFGLNASAGAITISASNGFDADTGLPSAASTLLIDNSTIATNAAATNGGDIELGGSASFVLRDSMVLASAGGQGFGGDIFIGAGAMTLQNSQIQSSAQAGVGGDIQIFSGATTLNNSSIATNATAGDGGDISLDTGGELLSLQNSSVVASAGSTGTGGDITLASLSAGSSLQNSQVQALANTGSGGTISLGLVDAAGGTLQLVNSQIATNATAANGGDIMIDTAGAQLLLMQNSSVVASAGGSGVGGDISLLNVNGATLADSQVQALASAGHGGTINVAFVAGANNALQLDRSSITTKADTSSGGDITVDTAGNQVLLRDSSSVIASAGGTGTGGNISVFNAGALILQDSQVQALADAGSGGTINVDLGDTPSGPVQLTNSSIRTNALNSNGGNISIDATGQRVSLQNSDIVASAGGTGTGGGITISNAAGTTLQGSRIQALAAAGTGGTITLSQAVGLGGAVTLDNSSIMTNATAANGGNIALQAAGNAVTLRNSSIVASAGGSGVGGGISINNAGATTLTGSQVQALANTGAGGTINIALASGQNGPLVLDNSSILTNATAANGGNIGVDAAGNQVVLNNSNIVASAGGSGTGGGISILNAGGATLRNTQVQALANSGTGGTITLDLTENSRAVVLDNSSIKTNATNANGGNITLDAAGNQVTLRNASIVASAGGAGAGGDIAIMNAGGAILLNTQIQALANAGAGGTISLDLADGSGALFIQRSNITTNAVAAGGGNITIDAAGNPLTLRDSTILASAGAAGTGGNVLIDNLGFTLMQRSQILARADAGNGGTITLNLTKGALFLRDAQSTISADSNSGNDGSVDINSPDTDLNPAVKPQDASLGETPELSANACTPVIDAARSTFVRDTRGGVSASPDGYLVSIQTDGLTQKSAVVPAAKPAESQWALRVASVQGIASSCADGVR